MPAPMMPILMGYEPSGRGAESAAADYSHANQFAWMLVADAKHRFSIQKGAPFVNAGQLGPLRG